MLKFDPTKPPESAGCADFSLLRRSASVSRALNKLNSGLADAPSPLAAPSRPPHSDRLWQADEIAPAIATGLAVCGQRPDGGSRISHSADVCLQWKLVTSWLTNFPGLGTGATRLAELITTTSGGRFSVRVFGTGQLVSDFDVFDAVSRGTAEMGHSASYYWKGKDAAAPFFCAVPFGLNA